MPKNEPMGSTLSESHKKSPLLSIAAQWRRDYSANAPSTTALGCADRRPSARLCLVVKPTPSWVQTPSEKNIRPPFARRTHYFWRTRRDSNPRPSASEADTLSN